MFPQRIHLLRFLFREQSRRKMEVRCKGDTINLWPSNASLVDEGDSNGKPGLIGTFREMVSPRYSFQ